MSIPSISIPPSSTVENTHREVPRKKIHRYPELQSKLHLDLQDLFFTPPALPRSPRTSYIAAFNSKGNQANHPAALEQLFKLLDSPASENTERLVKKLIDRLDLHELCVPVFASQAPPLHKAILNCQWPIVTYIINKLASTKGLLSASKDIYGRNALFLLTSSLCSETNSTIMKDLANIAKSIVMTIDTPQDFLILTNSGDTLFECRRPDREHPTVTKFFNFVEERMKLLAD